MRKAIAPGLRTLNMADKRSRIIDAARRLFTEHGFDAVTTQQVSVAAGIGVGTLFRYAATKGELLMMVYNHEFSDAIERGEIAAAQATSTQDAVWALALALNEFIVDNPHNTAMYERELLFGAPGAAHRDEGIALVDRWERAVAHRLADGYGVGADDERVALASRTAFAALSLIASDVRREERSTAQLQVQLAQITAGLGAQLAHRTQEP